MLWNLVAHKVIINKDVFVYTTISLKERKNFQASFIDKEKNTVTNVVVEVFDHYATSDMLQVEVVV